MKGGIFSHDSDQSQWQTDATNFLIMLFPFYIMINSSFSTAPWLAGNIRLLFLSPYKLSALPGRVLKQRIYEKHLCYSSGSREKNKVRL
jgi:hypothetical protein